MDITWVSVTLAMLGKFAINMSFTIIYIYGPEIYPTVVRYDKQELSFTKIQPELANLPLLHNLPNCPA